MSDNIEKLKKDREDHIKEMRSITSEAEKRSDRKMTEDEGKRWTELTNLVDGLKDEIERKQKMEDLDAEEARRIQTDQDKKKEPLGERRSITLEEDLRTILDKRAITGMSELVPSDGGYFVNTDQSSELIETTYSLSTLANKCRSINISSNANAVTFNAIDETSRVRGSHFGGVNGYWLEEAGEKSESKPTFRKIELKLKKLAALCYLTDELRNDAAALESLVRSMYPEEFAWLLDAAIWSGGGGGMPLGILNHPSTIAVTKDAGQLADTVIFDNLVSMYSRMVVGSMGRAEWYINQDVMPQLMTMAMVVGFGGVPVYLPANGASATPYGTIFGKPVNAIEHASTLGDLGDIAFLDLSQYMLARKGGVDQASSMHVRFLYDETVLRFVMRADGKPLWKSAVTPTNGNNTVSPFIFLEERA